MPPPQLKTLRRTAAMTARQVSKQGFGVVFRFRQFLIRGNVLEIAVGMIIANSFQVLLESFVRDLFTPILSLMGGKESLTFSEKHVVMYSPSDKTYSTREEAIKDKAITLDYGQFIQALINFLIAAVALFLLINFVQPLFQNKEEPRITCPYCREKIPQDALKCKFCASPLMHPSEPRLYTTLDHAEMDHTAGMYPEPM